MQNLKLLKLEKQNFQPLIQNFFEAKIDELNLKGIKSFYIGYLHMPEENNKFPATVSLVRMYFEIMLQCYLDDAFFSTDLINTIAGCFINVG